MSAFASASAALRIASLDLCADEYLLSIARPAEVASVSYLSHDPLETALAARARRFPANHGRVEEVLRQHPDALLVTGSAKGRDTIARRLGLRVVRLADAATATDVARNMARVAALLGDPARAHAFSAQLKALERTAPTRPQSAWWLGTGGLTLSEGSLGADWMRLAGLAQQPVPNGRVSLEQVAVAPPSVLLVSAYRRAQHSAGQAWLAHPLVKRSSARKVETDGRPWTCMGPTMLTEVARLRRAAR